MGSQEQIFPAREGRQHREERRGEERRGASRLDPIAHPCQGPGQRKKGETGGNLGETHVTRVQPGEQWRETQDGTSSPCTRL